MTCCHTSSGSPDCQQTACRTRWLVGSTTGEPFTPWPTLRGLVGDILETWSGEWMSQEDIAAHVLRIRPQADVESVDRAVGRMIARQEPGVLVRTDPSARGTEAARVWLMCPRRLPS